MGSWGLLSGQKSLCQSVDTLWDSTGLLILLELLMEGEADKIQVT